MERKCYVRELLFDVRSLDAPDCNLHVITVSDEHKGGCYQAITSLSAFESRLLNRWFATHRKKNSKSHPKYSRTFKDDLKHHRIKETFEHPSLKHFYDFIGYEPKRGKSLRYLDQFMGVWNNAN